MKAVYIEDFGGNEQIVIGERPTPEPEETEVQIKLAYTAVNPVDWKIREGFLESLLDHQFPLILGWDAAGAVSAVGASASKFKVGDEVYAYCRKPIVQWGTYAEYVCVDEENVAYKPTSLSMAEAASIPLVGLTAFQALFDIADLQAGQQVLVHAGAGGVGSLAVQLAKWGGATVYTTASAHNHDYVKSLGADVAIDYTAESFVERIQELVPDGLDMVYDCAGGKAHSDSYQLIKKGGCLVTIVEPVDKAQAAARELKAVSLFVRPSGEQLAAMARLFDEGKLAPPHIEERPLEEAVAALDHNRAGHTQGKVVLTIS